MRKLVFTLFLTATLIYAQMALCVDYAFHGDLNHRFLMLTNHFDWFQGDHKGILQEGNFEDSYAEVKYRLWTEIESSDKNIKGVFAIEMGGLAFGDKSKGGSYSGDGKNNIETRWAYTDFQIPNINNKVRLRIGLQPYNLSKWLWNETVMGVQYSEEFKGLDYHLAWLRPVNSFNLTKQDKNINDIDFFTARYNISPIKGLKTGIFGLFGRRSDQGDDYIETINYTINNPDKKNSRIYNSDKAITSQNYMIKRLPAEFRMSIYNFGFDGSFTQSVPSLGKIFINWDAIYQFGKIKDVQYIDFMANRGTTKVNVTTTTANGTNTTEQDVYLADAYGDFDLKGYFAHIDFGLDMDMFKITNTLWYTSGDSDPFDNNFDGFMSIDMHRSDSIILFEGSVADEKTFTGRQYLLDKGFMMIKSAVDVKVTDKIKVGGALMMMSTAEEINYNDPDSDEIYSESFIGYELDAYAKYQLYSNLEFALNFGYLMCGDAMDVFEEEQIQDGKSDEDIFTIASRFRYKF